MNKMIGATAFFLTVGVFGAATAATVTNNDDTAYTLLISEGGNQSELTIGPGETIQICPSGCFVTMPNGDREVLDGSETLHIEATRSVFE